MIEKLINEHGSAEIMEKRLALMKEEAAVVERRCADLESANASLSGDLTKAHQKIEQLTKALGEASPAPEELLNDFEIQILLNISGHLGGAIARGISHDTTIPQIKVDYFLQCLEEGGYIIGRHSRIEESSYEMDQRGREYLIRSNLV